MKRILIDFFRFGQRKPVTPPFFVLLQLLILGIGLITHHFKIAFVIGCVIEFVIALIQLILFEDK